MFSEATKWILNIKWKLTIENIRGSQIGDGNVQVVAGRREVRTVLRVGKN